MLKEDLININVYTDNNIDYYTDAELQEIADSEQADTILMLCDSE